MTLTTQLTTHGMILSETDRRRIDRRAPSRRQALQGPVTPFGTASAPAAGFGRGREIGNRPLTRRIHAGNAPVGRSGEKGDDRHDQRDGPASGLQHPVVP
jgi:hypothetical protein